MSTDLIPYEPPSREEWLHLLQQCQNGEATCVYVLLAIEKAIDHAVAEALIQQKGTAK